MSHLIAFTGKAGSGKSTAAAALAEEGFQRVRFAAPLKAMLATFYMHCGLIADEVERRIEGDLKEVPDPLLGGKTPRYAMQTLGTEWGREMIWDDLWVNAWAEKVQSLLDMGFAVVCEDCRFPNEAERIRALGGKIVRIDGRGGIDGGHASEAGEIKPDCILLNTPPTADAFRAGVQDLLGVEGEMWHRWEEQEDEESVEDTRAAISDDGYYTELALRVLSLAHDPEGATEVIRQAMQEAHDLWAAENYAPLTEADFNEVERRVLAGMAEELMEATGRAMTEALVDAALDASAPLVPYAELFKTTHLSPHTSQQEAVKIDVRPGITVDELRVQARNFLGDEHTDPGLARLAQFNQAVSHLGVEKFADYDQSQRTRFSFYMDVWTAGISMTPGQMDCTLAAVIGGEQ